MSKTIPSVIPSSISPYLNEIAERLWSGHAAVMVGAGFSRNARPNGTSCSVFPDWHQLGDLFYEGAYGGTPDTKSKYLNVLKLADEMQAALGRPALDQALRDAIPDYEYEPSPLHVKLLDLPWTDVFTTNYDTLLERACTSITSQKYDVVVNKEDLVYSAKPRIIKLHGSFPSERPFIITEEDYRRYPKDFAPFVNTVQQALLENTLCLIGFSGDDPNFLQWIGWIRDNLGNQNSPKIYLIGVLNLSVAQVKLLEQRNIVLVDMSKCAGIDGDHYKGLEQFLEYLISRKAEDNRLEWPKVLSHLHPDLNKDKTDQIEELLPVWKEQRLSYPGWIIVPEDRRSSLWTFTQSWISFASSKDSFSKLIDLEFAFELNWRMEKCLCPILNQQIEFFEAVLGRYLPLGVMATSDKSLPLATKEISGRGLDRKEIRRMCICLLLSMMRFYREEGLLEKWKEADGKIESLREHLSSEQKASLYYERALYALFGLDMPELKNRLREWQVNESLPFMEAKKGALLAEIGQVNEAEQLLEQSLKNIRAKLNLKPITTDYSLVSQEAIVMLLLQYVQTSVAAGNGKWSETQEIRKAFSERWNVLKQYKCEPWNELKIFEGSLERPPVAKRNVTEKKEFDIGRVTRINHFAGWDNEALIAYSFLRFCEDAGIPFRIPSSTFGKKSAEGTLSRISKYSPYWAMATMVRIGDEKVVDHVFNRESLFKIETASVNSLVEGYLESLEKSVGDIRSGNRFYADNFGIILAKVVPEILSRLCCKCSLESKEMLINFLLKVYKSDHRGNYGGIRHLTERLLSAFSVRQRFDLIPILLDFPVLENLGPIEEREFVNPFQFINLERELIQTWVKPIIPDEKINILLEKASSDNSNARKWAIFTLVQLHNLGFLERRQTDKFTEALWCKLDDYGLPSQTDYYKFAFIDLPHPTNVDPISLLKKYIQRESFPIQKNRAEKSISITGGDVPLCREIVGASKYPQWSDADVIMIFDRLVEWWDADKDYLKKENTPSTFSSVADEFRGRFAKLVDVLEAFIAPNFNQDTENEKKETLRRLICELREHGLPALRLESASLHIYPDWKSDILDKIENGLASSIGETVIDSLRAVLVILEKNALYPDEQDLSNILNVLGQIVRWQKKTGLPSVLNVLTRIVKKYPSLFSNELERLVLVGLQKLAKDTIMGEDGMELHEGLAIRQEAAGLAYGLFMHYTRQSQTVPDAITEWQEICRSDNEFAEIRNQWIQEN
ncbi:SIR2 family protein [Geothermobacter hydrogeniphilus]|uniref:SIR2 family protein n=1 Tax=Geothermobacter hydrogeniphilus TaxID=1969733 RepID=A0A2K2H975_9BACT|nr:anti-phage defense-associated sirtuin Dsr2 [Geothermobacter hydrogeniphilus]PNU19875.1 SIR2 family protein [Geothermobacter hydrogeniphilus]